MKVVDYERAGARIRQTTELRGEIAAFLRRLKVKPPPKLHEIGPAPAGSCT